MKLPLPAFAKSFSDRRNWPAGVDLTIFAVVIAAFYAFTGLMHYWWSAAVPNVEISHSARLSARLRSSIRWFACSRLMRSA